MLRSCGDLGDGTDVEISQYYEGGRNINTIEPQYHTGKLIMNTWSNKWKKETSWGSNTFDLTNTPIGHSGHSQNESHAALNGKWWRQDFLRSPRGRYRIKAPFTGTIAIGFDKDYPRTNSFIWKKQSNDMAKLNVSASMEASGGTPDTVSYTHLTLPTKA